jgi:hypothetical protein
LSSILPDNNNSNENKNDNTSYSPVSPPFSPENDEDEFASSQSAAAIAHALQSREFLDTILRQADNPPQASLSSVDLSAAQDVPLAAQHADLALQAEQDRLQSMAQLASDSSNPSLTALPTTAETIRETLLPLMISTHLRSRVLGNLPAFSFLNKIQQRAWATALIAHAKEMHQALDIWDATKNGLVLVNVLLKTINLPINTILPVSRLKPKHLKVRGRLSLKVVRTTPLISEVLPFLQMTMMRTHP